jgi:hypothetical protein
MIKSEKDKKDLLTLISDLLINARNTLPNEIIRFFHNNNYSPANFEEISEDINPKYDSLRKMDNTKYSNSKKKAILSTLTSIDLFLYDKESGLYTLNQSTAVHYLSRSQKKKKKKEIKKEYLDEIKSEDDNLDYNENDNNINNDNQDFLCKKRKIISKTLTNSHSSKYIVAYELLDELLEKYIKLLDGKKIMTNPFSKIGDITDFIAKVKNKEKLEGILICFKFFKPILRKIFLYKNKFVFQNLKQIFEKLNNFNEKVDLVQKYLENDKE